MAFLRVDKGNTTWRVLELEGERTVFGRHPSCQVVLDNEAVSRQHAQILENHGHYFLEDLKSRNGTLLNGKRIDAPVELHDEDLITLCDIEFAFHQHAPRQHQPKSLLDTEIDDSGSRVFPIGVEPIDDDIDSSSIVSRLSVSPTDRTSAGADPEVKLRAILDISKSLGQVIELDAVLARILDGLFDIFPQVEDGVVLLRDGEQLVVKAERLRSDDKAGRNKPRSISLTVVREAIASGSAILSADALGDDRFDSSQSIVGMKLRSMMCAPLPGQDGEALGVIQLATRDITQPFSESDLDVLVSLGSQAALAIENAELHEAAIRRRDLDRELEFATQVQLGFLPNQRPDVRDLEFYDYYEAAHRVGGDYFDYVELPDRRIAVAVADVAGKGIPAALLMARLYSAARFHLLRESTVAGALGGLNREISASGMGHRFITCILAVIDPEQRVVTVANAGHMPPMTKDADGNVAEQTSDQSGMPLGILPDQVFAETTMPLVPGETWLMYTDGVSEAMDQQSEIYGSTRLLECLAAAPSSLDELVKAIISDVEVHCSGRSQSDDMCLVTFRFAPE